MLCHSTTNPPPLVMLTNHPGPCLSFHSCRVVATSHSSSPSDNNTNNNNNNNNNSTVSQYYANRVQHLNTLLQNQSLKHPNHMTMYPNKFEISRTLEQYVNEYTNTSTVEPGQKLMHITEKISGRILSVRKASNKLLFATVRNGDATFTVQIMMTKQAYGNNEEFDIMVQTLKRGDHIGIVGHPCKTGTGELSILPTQIVILSPCLHVLPDSFSSTSLLDPEVRYRNRALDFVVHHDTLVPHFQTRSNVLTFFRIFLQSRDFVEVETPILSLQSGGAAARPFITQLNSMGGDVELKLRIAPELYLKELVIGGMERVFELGKVFRNEGVDATHNPEFTSCELYMAHADYNDIMRFTEDLFRGCALFLHELKSAKKVGSGVIQTALKIAGGNSVQEDEKAGIIEYTVEAGSKVDAQVIHIDLTKPFKRISYLDSIEEEIGEKIPRGEALTSAATIQQLINACKRHRIDLDKGRVGDVAYLLDRLLSNLVEPKCIQPTFICDHPALISPLAKSHESDPTLTERFELFVAGRELCNAYTELNDPVEQRRRFEQQVQAKEDHGDVEAHEKDENFCRSLEYGLPPTGGWGCGIDRLVMLLTNSWNIRDVLLFPMMKPKESAAAATTIESTTPPPSNQ